MWRLSTRRSGEGGPPGGVVKVVLQEEGLRLSPKGMDRGCPPGGGVEVVHLEEG